MAKNIIAWKTIQRSYQFVVFAPAQTVCIPSMKESVVFNWSNKADNLQLQVHLSTGNVIPVVNC